MDMYIGRKAIKQNQNLSIIEIKWKVVVRESHMGGLRPLRCSKSWPGEWLQSTHMYSFFCIFHTLKTQNKSFNFPDSPPKSQMHSLKLCILLSINDFLSTNHGPGIVLETRDRGVNKTQARTGFCCLGMYFEREGQT